MSARIKKFIGYGGLSEYSGLVNKEDFVRFIVKETIDNALDVGETTRVSVKIWRETASGLYISVSNYGVVSEENYITKGKIEDLLNFDYSPSSKSEKHIISRGTKGNALQTAIGMSYCFWTENTRPEFTTEIIGHNSRFKIKLLPHDDVIEHAPIEPEPIESVGVTTFLFKLNLAKFNTPSDIVWFFSRLHKHIIFEYSCVGEAPLLLNSDCSGFKNPMDMDQGYGLISTYSLDDLLALIDRLISCVKTSKMTVRQFIEKFQGFSHSAAQVCKDVGIEEQETVSNIGKTKIEELLGYMKKAKKVKDPRPRQGAKDFPSLGKALRENEGDVLKWIADIYQDTERDCSVPFIVEAVAFKKRGLQARLYPAVNFSPNLHEPFKRTKVKGTSSDNDIYDIVKKSGLDVIFHLICPNIHWSDSNKGYFDTEPFIQSVFKVIKDVCRKHNASSMDTQALIDAANKVLDGHPNSLYSERELHYKLLSTIPEYKNISADPCATFGKALTIARKTKGDRGTALRQVDPDRIVDNTRPAFKNNPSHRDLSEYLTYAYKKLVNDCDLERWESQNYAVEVWIEKEALSRIIKPICEKYRVNLFVGKGFSSFTQVYEAIHDRFPRDGRTFVILYFGDLDKTGVNISDSLKERIIAEAEMQGIRIDDDSVIFKRCALKYEQIKNWNLPSIPMTDKEVKSSPDWVRVYGPNKWELDVLEPETLIALTETWIRWYITDWEAWSARDAEVESFKQYLKDEFRKSDFNPFA